LARAAHDGCAGKRDHGFVKEAASERPVMEVTLNTSHETRDEWTGFPSAVESLIQVRTADAVFVVDPEYRIVHWDDRRSPSQASWPRR
jgi:hypothetical protein